MKKLFAWRIHILFWTLFLTLLGAGTFLRLHGLDWGDFSRKDRVLTFHPDEQKLLFIAREFLKEDFSFDLGFRKPVDYTKGFSFQIAIIARLIHALWETFSVSQLYLIARYLSLLYGIATLLVLFAITRLLLKNRWKALFAMGFLAFSALHVENSHYGTADVASIFWVYLSFFFALLEETKSRAWKRIAIAGCAGIALALKFSFVPLIPLLYLCYLHRFHASKILLYFALTFAFFCLANGMDYSLHDFRKTFLMFLNDNIHTREHNKWLNPFIYFFQLIPALGLATFLLALYGTWREGKSIVYSKKEKKINWHIVFIFLTPLFLYFLTICYLDIPFTRHVLKLVPLFCILGAAGLSHFFHHLIATKRILTMSGLGTLILIYQFIYCFSVAYYFERDPRLNAMRWIKKNIPKGSILALSPYAFAPRGFRILPNLEHHFFEAQYLVLHESYYYRYLRSELNPLRPASHIDEVYRGRGNNLVNLNLLFAGELPFKKIKSFEVKTVTPELFLYKKLFGTFPHFLGDVLIYERIS